MIPYVDNPEFLLKVSTSLQSSRSIIPDLFLDISLKVNHPYNNLNMTKVILFCSIVTAPQYLLLQPTSLFLLMASICYFPVTNSFESKKKENSFLPPTNLHPSCYQVLSFLFPQCSSHPSPAFLYQHCYYTG